MYEKIRIFWDRIQDLLDVRGDVIMLVISGTFIVRTLLVLRGYASITASEAAFYASAVTAFAYSNRGPK